MLICGDCLDVLPTLEAESVDAVITDPPYPCIKRDYGYWTEAEWWELIVEGVIPEVRRILKPTGSAVFILQPNSEKVGKMRGWLWEFMAWVCREWNMVQDVWWWNINTPPRGSIKRGLMRPSIKSCIWCGKVDCFRDVSKVLNEASPAMKYLKEYYKRRISRETSPGGLSFNRSLSNSAWEENGGVIPFNVLPIGVSGAAIDNAGVNGHSAGTPLKLIDWWVRYIVPPGGVVLDPFAGVCTTGLACIDEGRDYILIEREREYCDIAEAKLAAKLAEVKQMELDLC